jgi:dTDP-4-dehydrorhamnose reductase
MKNKIAITGSHGRLGKALVALGGIPIESDILKADKLHKEVASINPDFIIHAAALTNVDMAEDCPEQAMQINVRGTANVRDSFLGHMILISTDYVFDGRSGPYRENDLPNPINWYGHSKLAAESMLDLRKDVVIRTTLLYGDLDKVDFVSSILDKYDSGHLFFVTDKLQGNPTYVKHLAQGIFSLVEKISAGMNFPDIINIVGKPRMSRYQFAYKIGKVFGKDLTQCQSSLTGLPVDRAARPLKAGLITDRAEKLEIPIWSVDEGLKEMREDMKNEKDK